MASTSSRTLSSSLDKLSISDSAKSAPKQKKAQPADSWEDDVEDGPDTETDSGTATPVRHVTSSDYPGAPPPTPASPSGKGFSYQAFPSFRPDGTPEDWSSGENSPAKGVAAEERRPEKSTAVASRLIAAGIGQKAPRRTKEQREYDQAMRMQEKKKRDQAKAEEEKKQAEKEKAKAAIWDD